MTNQPVHITPDPMDVQQNKIFALLSYLGILLLIPLLMRRDSQFCRYHLNQGLILFIANVIINILSGFIGLLGILSIATLIFMIMGIVNCCKGVCAPLPLIGNITLIS